jgi:hypothetical protein
MIYYSKTPLNWTLVIRNSIYPDRLGPSAKFVENYTKLTCLEITGYRIKNSTVLWLLELQIKRGRMVYTQVHTVNSNSRTPNCQSSLFSKRNSIIRIFCKSGWLAVPINAGKWSSTVHELWRMGSVNFFSTQGTRPLSQCSVQNRFRSYQEMYQESFGPSDNQKILHKRRISADCLLIILNMCVFLSSEIRD